MLVFPYRLGVRLRKPPYISIAIASLCVLAFLVVSDNHQAITNHAKQFCAIQAEKAIDGVHGTTIRVRGEERSCEWVMTQIHLGESPEQRLKAAVRAMLGRQDLESANRAQSLYRAFSAEAPRDISPVLLHYVGRFDLAGIFTSLFLHEEFDRLVYNLVLFLFFAPALELLLGSKRFFGIVVVFLIFHAAGNYAHAWWVNYHGSRYGLSGLVSGCIGLFLVLLNQVKVRSVVWAVRG